MQDAVGVPCMTHCNRGVPHLLSSLSTKHPSCLLMVHFILRRSNMLLLIASQEPLSVTHDAR
jgi:hypothetical protein